MKRAMAVDALLCSLNPPESGIDKKWAEVARKRLEEIRSCTVATVPCEQVFAKIWKRSEG